MPFREYVKRVLIVLGLVTTFVALWWLRNLVLLAFLSAIIAVSLNILVIKFQRLGMRRGPAIALTLAVVLAVVVLFLASVLPVIVSQTVDLVSNLPNAFNEGTALYTIWYADQGELIQNVLPEYNDDVFNELITDVNRFISPFVTGVGTAVGNIVANVFIIVMISVFLLIEPQTYVRGFIALVPLESRQRALEIINELRQTVTSWMNTLAFSIGITIFLVWFLLGVVLSVPNALALGAIAGLMTIIPIIGSIVPFTLIIIFTAADDPAKLVIVIPVFVLIQIMEANILTPTVIREELNIPVGLILFFQLLSATLFGFFGILLAVPLLATIITLVRELYVYDVLGTRGINMDIRIGEDGSLTITTQDDALPEEDSTPRQLPRQVTPEKRRESTS